MKIIASACLLLGSKMKDAETKLKYICFSYHKLISKCFHKKRIILLDDDLQYQIKEEICMAEFQLLKTIGFNFEYSMPYDFLDYLISNFYDNKGI